jgi:hypothetical protein
VGQAGGGPLDGRVRRHCQTSLHFSHVASNAHLVSLWIAKVGSEVVFMVLRPQPGSPFACSTVCEPNLVCDANLLTARRSERNHLTVSRMVRLTVEWLAYYEERSRVAFAVPAGPRLFPLAKPKVNPEALHQRAVKVERPFEVGDAYEYVREQDWSL